MLIITRVTVPQVMAQQSPYASKQSHPPIFLPNIHPLNYLHKPLPFLINFDYMSNSHYM